MQMSFKGLKIGNLIITTEKQLLKDNVFSVETKEVYELFVKALRETKIVFNKVEASASEMK